MGTISASASGKLEFWNGSEDPRLPAFASGGSCSAALEKDLPLALRAG
jgi:hypothetical protein